MKLSMGDVMQSAAISLWRGGQPMALCLGLWAGAQLSFVLVRKAYDPVGYLIVNSDMWGLMDLRSLNSGTVFSLREMIDGGLQDLVGCVFVAAMLRIILIGKVGIRSAGQGGLARAAGGVFLLGLAVTTATNVLSVLANGLLDTSSRADWYGFMDIVAPLIFVVVLVYLAARLCLVYPSAAVGQGWVVARNWRRTAGNGIRMSVVFAMVLVGIAVADTLLDIFIFGIPYGGARIEWLGTVLAAKEVVKSVLIGTSLLALSAVAFARLTEFPAIGVPGASKTPEQLAEAFE